MTIYALLFISIVLTSVIVLITVGVKAVRGRGKAALRLLGVWVACVAIYLGICIATAASQKQETLEFGDPECYDDWCMEVDQLSWMPETNSNDYTATIQLKSRARRAVQRETNVELLLEDTYGNRYPAEPSPNEPPFDVQLGPGESVTTHRTFQLPRLSNPASLVLTHGSFQMGWLVIGEGQSMFHKEPKIRIHLIAR